jgi:hypothetical protein
MILWQYAAFRASAEVEIKSLFFLDITPSKYVDVNDDSGKQISSIFKR